MNTNDLIKGFLSNTSSSLMFKQLQKQYLRSISPVLTTVMASPFSSALKSIQRQHMATISSVLTSAMSFQDSSTISAMQRQYLASMSPTLKAIMFASASSAFKTMSKHNNKVSADLIKTFKSTISLQISSALESVQQSRCLDNILLNPIFPEIRKINNLINKSDLSVTTYNDLISIGLQSEFDETHDTDAIYKNIDSKFNESRKDKLSLDFFSIIIVPFVFQVYSSMSASNDKKEILSMITSSENRIVEQINILKKESDDYHYYVIIRAINGHEYPNMNSKIKFILYPNQKVRLVDNKGKWIRIEYFNHFENHHKDAWILKKYAQFIM